MLSIIQKRNAEFPLRNPNNGIQEWEHQKIIFKHGLLSCGVLCAMTARD